MEDGQGLATPAVEARGLSFRYPTRVVWALRDLDLDVAPGERLLVLGPSGSGKSTLTLCLDGLIPHVVEGEMEGTIAVAGLATAHHPVHLLAQEAGLVFQDPEGQFCTLTVEDEVAFGLENLRTPPERMDAVIDGVLAQVGLAGFRRRRLETLSGGEKQRLAVAAVLAMGPRLLVLDEPSANLDPAGTRDLFSLLERLGRDPGRTIVLIEHKLDELMSFIDRVVVLAADGSLLTQGGPAEVFHDRDGTLREAGVWRPRVVEAVTGLRRRGWPVPGRPLEAEETAAALMSVPGLAERLRETPSLAEAGSRPPAATPRAPLLEVRGLDYVYPDGEQAPRAALTDLSLAVAAGELLAVVGPNGAGKSTLAGLVSGVLRAPAGCVFLEGRDVRSLSSRELAARVGHVFQNPEHQFVTERVYDELAFSLSGGRRGTRRPPDDDLIRSWLERFGLAALAEENPFSLSQGQKRRLSVAAILIRGQELVVLDEPTFGQDRTQTERLIELVMSLWRGGRTLIILTHDMDLVARCGSLLVLEGGHALYRGEPRAFFQQPELVERAGLSVPPVGRLAAALGAPRLLTVEDLLAAAGTRSPGDDR